MSPDRQPRWPSSDISHHPVEVREAMLVHPSTGRSSEEVEDITREARRAAILISQERKFKLARGAIVPGVHFTPDTIRTIDARRASRELDN